LCQFDNLFRNQLSHGVGALNPSASHVVTNAFPITSTVSGSKA
jgi:hypothetical protein